MKNYTLLALGSASQETDEAWLESSRITRIFRHRRAAVNGKRFGSRVLGIGLDALILAVRTLHPSVRGPYLANNPWIGAALRVTGRNDFVVTGIYAEPASRSWRVLSKLIGKNQVIALSKSETSSWNAAGGSADAVLYGNSFGYPKKGNSQHFHIFVGGTSDRDPLAIEAIEAEVLASKEPVHLTLAIGTAGDEIRKDGNVVSRPGYLSREDFGTYLSTASVVFLPISQGTRAAGHMVLVGALESGIPVSVTPSDGMREYIIGPAVVACDTRRPILPQLRELAAQPGTDAESVRRFWDEVFALRRYIARVSSKL